METPKPTNRELAIMLQANLEKNELQHQAILQSLNDFHISTKDTLEKIVAQTTKTNGRVTNLENKYFMLVGANAILSFAIPLVVKALFN